MNNKILRTAALLIHALLNIVITSWLTNFDITGSWLMVIVFVLTLFVLVVLFVKHILSFINFLKTH